MQFAKLICTRILAQVKLSCWICFYGSSKFASKLYHYNLQAFAYEDELLALAGVCLIEKSKGLKRKNT